MSDEPDRRPYLLDHPPARRQYRSERRAKPSGAIVVHTFENVADLKPPDAKAETGAAYIANRTNAPGSYHTVVDSDSAVQLGYYRWEMFGEGTGGNRWALHLSYACQADRWKSYPDWWVEGAIEQGAIEADRMARWIKSERGIEVPARRITLSEYRNQRPGFIAHGTIDPTRRHDPGEDYLWELFLERFAHYQGDTMPTYPTEDVKTIQTKLTQAGYDIGPTGVDGILGPKTMAAFNAAMTDLGMTGAHVEELAKKANLLDRFAKSTTNIENGQKTLETVRTEIRDLYQI